MRVSLQIAIGYFLTVGLAAWFVLNVFSEQVKPGVREAMEDTLVDTANLLAEVAAADLRAGRIADGELAKALHSYRDRPLDAAIWGIHKRSLDYRIYVTDARGKVVYSTEAEQVGQDFSRWRDVFLTLRGEYGARSTRDTPEDANSTVMHVAAPLRDDAGRIVGVLTVAKPNSTVQPFIERSESIIRERGALLLAITALIGVVFTWHLTRAIKRLQRYAQSVADGHKAIRPPTRATELDDLGRSLEAMREKLEGKHYLERYVHTLTHELKSPLAAIRGAVELLAEAGMSEAERRHFLANIGEQSERLREIADKMLQLVRLEQQQTLESPTPIDLCGLLGTLAESVAPRCQAAGVILKLDCRDQPTLTGDAFLLRLALAALIDNAIEFSPPQGHIEISAFRSDKTIRIEVRDNGPGIPDYAEERVFERFFSLPRPATQRKSTGLGLAMAREVAELHSGSIGIANQPQGGTLAWLELPGSA